MGAGTIMGSPEAVSSVSSRNFQLLWLGVLSTNGLGDVNGLAPQSDIPTGAGPGYQ